MSFQGTGTNASFYPHIHAHIRLSACLPACFPACLPARMPACLVPIHTPTRTPPTHTYTHSIYSRQIRTNQGCVCTQNGFVLFDVRLRSSWSHSTESITKAQLRSKHTRAHMHARTLHTCMPCCSTSVARYMKTSSCVRVPGC